MIAHPSTEKLETITNCIKALGHARTFGKYQDRLVKKYGIQVVAEIPLGRGTSRMMKKSQMDELIAKHVRPARQEVQTHDDPQLHIFALEERLKEQTHEIRGLREEMAVLVAAQNLTTSRLNQVLTELGCAS